MDQAQGALDAARAAGADRYAVDEYTAAASALKSAQDAVAQHGLVQLADMVLGRTHVGVGLEREVHRLGVSGHFLLITRLERLNRDRPREQVLDLGI